MSINTINSTVKHVESIVNKLKATDKLPFTDVLSPQSVNEKFNGIPLKKWGIALGVMNPEWLSVDLSRFLGCKNQEIYIISGLHKKWLNLILVPLDPNIT